VGEHDDLGDARVALEPQSIEPRILGSWRVRITRSQWPTDKLNIVIDGSNLLYDPNKEVSLLPVLTLTAKALQEGLRVVCVFDRSVYAVLSTAAEVGSASALKHIVRTFPQVFRLSTRGMAADPEILKLAIDSSAIIVSSDRFRDQPLLPRYERHVGIERVNAAWHCGRLWLDGPIEAGITVDYDLQRLSRVIAKSLDVDVGDLMETILSLPSGRSASHSADDDRDGSVAIGLMLEPDQPSDISVVPASFVVPIGNARGQADERSCGHQARVCGINQNEVLCELPNGAVGCVPFDQLREDPPRVGTMLKVRIERLDESSAFYWCAIVDQIELP
jgi:hypothetical protein